MSFSAFDFRGQEDKLIQFFRQVFDSIASLCRAVAVGGLVREGWQIECLNKVFYERDYRSWKLIVFLSGFGVIALHILPYNIHLVYHYKYPCLLFDAAINLYQLLSHSFYTLLITNINHDHNHITAGVVVFPCFLCFAAYFKCH